jgi:hypothetical protein
MLDALLGAVLPKRDEEPVAGEGLYKRLWEDSVSARKPLEQQWQVNTNYVLGNQWIEFNNRTLLVQNLQSPSYRIRATDNLLFGKVRSAISRHLTNPRAQVIPETRSDMDMRRSEAKEGVLNHLWHATQLPTKLWHALWWGKVCGNAFFYVDWDKWGGDTYKDESGQYGLGEVAVEVLSPWSVWIDPAAGPESWGRYCWVGRMEDVQDVKVKYGVDDIPTDGDAHEYENMTGMLGSSSPNRQGSYQDDYRRKYKGHCLVKTLYRFRSESLPGGQVVTMVGDTVLEEAPLTWFPLVNYCNIPWLDMPWGDTEVRQALERQKTRNRMLSSLEEYTRVMAKGKWLAHKASKISAGTLNSEHGEIVSWEGNQPPQPITVPSLPAEVLRVFESTQQAIDDIFADHPVSQGKSIGANSAATTVQMLQEADTQQHSPNIILWEQSLRTLYQKMLDCAAKNYQQGRKISVLGEDAKADIRVLDRGMDSYGQPTGEDLLGGPNRVHIQTGSSIPENKALRSEIVRRNFQSGLYGNPQDPDVRREVLRMLDVGVIDTLYRDIKLDEAKATLENQTLITDPAAVIYADELDNHVVHVRSHERVMKSPEFAQLPALQQIPMRAHRIQHLMLMSEGANPLQQAMQGSALGQSQTQGQPGAAGETPDNPPTPDGNGPGPQGAVDIISGATPTAQVTPGG